MLSDIIQMSFKSAKEKLAGMVDDMKVGLTNSLKEARERIMNLKDEQVLEFEEWTQRHCPTVASQEFIDKLYMMGASTASV